MVLDSTGQNITPTAIRDILSVSFQGSVLWVTSLACVSLSSPKKWVLGIKPGIGSGTIDMDLMNTAPPDSEILSIHPI